MLIKKHPIYNFELSSEGNVYKNGKQLKLYERTNLKNEKYLYLQFSFNGKQHKMKITDLMADTFLEKKDITINVDNDYTNNKLENLLSLTFEEYIKMEIKENVTIKKIKLLENDYFLVSNGDLFSLKYKCFLIKQLDRKGYNYYSLRNNKEEKKFKTHRLVAIYFLEPIKGKDIVNHKDLVKTNNWDWNLEWVTHQENVDHAKINGRMIAKGQKKVVQLLDGEIINIYESLSHAAKAVGSTAINISLAARSNGKKIVKGYNWKLCID